MCAPSSISGRFDLPALSEVQRHLTNVMNASAVALFVFSPDAHWLQVAIAAAGASLGGWAGALALKRINEKALRVAVVAIGAALTVGLFVKSP